ncbi:MAG TPA: ABC transporter permease [Myxococcales bacterium]|nr:ABC transporter permease [Myxococcales bacterium]
MGRFLIIAMCNLRQSTKRTLLLGSAIAGVTMLLVLLGGLTNGIEQTMLRAATTLSTGHVNIGGFYKVTSGQAAPIVTNYKPLLELARKEVPEIRHVVDRVRGWGRVVSHKTTLQLGYLGVDIRDEAGIREVLEVLDGSLDDLRNPDTLMICESQSKKLDVGVGDKITLSAPTFRGAYNSVDVTVVAVVKEVGMISKWNVIMPKETVRKLYLMGGDATGAIQLYLTDPDDSDEVGERLRKAVADAGYRIMEPLAEPFWRKFGVVTREAWTGQKIDVTTWKDELQFMQWTIKGFKSLTAMLIFVLMIIIVIGVMNSLWMSIRERTREIGTLRAIGMGRFSVLVMFVMEAAILSIGATIVGAAIGLLATGVINAMEISLSEAFQVFLMRDTLLLAVDPFNVLKSIAIICTITTLFSLYPSYRATRMKPITAISHVG